MRLIVQAVLVVHCINKQGLIKVLGSSTSESAGSILTMHNMNEIMNADFLWLAFQVFFDVRNDDLSFLSNRNKDSFNA